MLAGDATPKVGTTYAINEKGGNSAVTIINGTSVTMQDWNSLMTQRWECVEKDGWLGFICRASTASDNGAYLGYNSNEVLICSAQYQDKWEDFQAVLRDDGFQLEMRKDDHLAYVGVDGSDLKMLGDRTTWWAFTELV
jgi:hypothetical protein